MSESFAVSGELLRTLASNSTETDTSGQFPADSLDALRKSGLMGFLVPPEHDGIGGSLAQYVEVAGQLAGACHTTAQIWVMHTLQIDAIVRYATEETKKAVLPRVAAGNCYIASVTTDEGEHNGILTAGSAARPDTDGVEIHRRAPIVTGGLHADAYLVTMRATPTATSQQLSLYYVDRDQLTVEQTSEWDTLGVRGTQSVGLELRGQVPPDNLIGRPGEFSTIARESMIPLSHLGWSACWLGTARQALRDLVRWLPGTGKLERPGNGLLHARLAQIRIELELVSGYLTRVREEIETKREHGQSAFLPATQLHLNTLKVAASDLAYKAVDSMLEIAGLRSGYLKTGPLRLERHLRDLRSGSLNHGNDALRMDISALTLLDRATSLI